MSEIAQFILYLRSLPHTLTNTYYGLSIQTKYKILLHLFNMIPMHLSPLGLGPSVPVGLSSKSDVPLASSYGVSFLYSPHPQVE